MKKVVLAILTISIFSMNSLAQEKMNYKEIKLSQRSGEINVSADQLWELIGPQFSQAHVWASSVDHAVTHGKGKFEGATCDGRVCNINAKGFSKINEVITIYNAETRTLAFDVTEGLPGFVLKANSHWQVIDLGNGKSAIEITVTNHSKKFMGTLMGGMLKKNIEKIIPVLLEDISVYAETGKPSENKQKRMAELAKKN